MEGGGGIGGVEGDEGIGDGIGGGIDVVADFAFGDDFGEAADFGDENRLLEMVGNLGDAALSGGLVGLRDDVTGAEESVDFGVGDVFCEEVDAVFEVVALDDFHIRGAVFIVLPCHYEVYVVLFEAFVGHCLEEEVKTFVGADEAEEEDISVRGVEVQRVQGVIPVEKDAIVVINGMRRGNLGAIVSVELFDIFKDFV